MDKRITFNILYRRYSDTRSSFLQVRARNDREAMRALTEHVGSFRYTVTSLRYA